MVPPKGRSRYLPTLTQVVSPDELSGANADFLESEIPAGPENDEQRIQRLTEDLMPQISARIHERIQEMWDAQLHQLEANLRADMESMVRDAVKGCKSPPTE